MGCEMISILYIGGLIVLFRFIRFKLKTRSVFTAGFKAGYEQGLSHGGVAFTELQRVATADAFQTNLYMPVIVNIPEMPNDQR